MTERKVPGEAHGADEAQKLWDAVALERGAVDDTPPETPPVVVEPAVEEPKAESAPAPAAAVVDPFEGLAPEVRKRLEAVAQLEQSIPQLVQSLRTAEGRVAAMQREMDVARNAAKAVDQAPSQAQIAAAAADTEKWSSLKSEFPEWADATEAFVNAKLAGLPAAQTAGLSADQVQQLLADQATQIRASTAAQLEEARVEGKYENWVEVINGDAFVGWMANQPAEVKQLAHSTRGRDAVRLLDLFHEAAAAPAEVVQEVRINKLAQAVSTAPKQPAPAGKTVDQMSPAELWEYERKRAAKNGAERGLTY